MDDFICMGHLLTCLISNQIELLVRIHKSHNVEINWERVLRPNGRSRPDCQEKFNELLKNPTQVPQAGSSDAGPSRKRKDTTNTDEEEEEEDTGSSKPETKRARMATEQEDAESPLAAGAAAGTGEEEDYDSQDPDPPSPLGDINHMTEWEQNKAIREHGEAMCQYQHAKNKHRRNKSWERRMVEESKKTFEEKQKEEE